MFVCFSTSAVYLDIVSDYSTQGFIATYKWFISGRGIPDSIYSDYRTNFIGADAEFQKLFSQVTHEYHQIAAMLSQDRTYWHFNPPAVPHMGGKWEVVVKSMKFYIRHTIGDILMTFEEATTLLAQIEAILNSRPLEPFSDDSDDNCALTPGHFFIGTAKCLA